MDALVVVESVFGNTRAVADAIATGLAQTHDGPHDGRHRRAVSGFRCGPIVVGGPTHAFGMTRPATRRAAADQSGGTVQADSVGLREWLATLPAGTAAVATFDTRMGQLRIPGSAAKGAARMLAKRGYPMLARPMTFQVAGTQGPLLDGERERALRPGGPGWPGNWSTAGPPRPARADPSPLTPTGGESPVDGLGADEGGVLSTVRQPLGGALGRGGRSGARAVGVRSSASTARRRRAVRGPADRRPVRWPERTLLGLGPCARCPAGPPVTVAAWTAPAAADPIGGAGRARRLPGRGGPRRRAAGSAALRSSGSRRSRSAKRRSLRLPGRGRAGRPLVAVHSWTEAFAAPSLTVLMYRSEDQAYEEELLAQRLAGWAEKYPEVEVKRIVVHDRAAHLLIEKSHTAQLVVVGSRGHGEFAGLVLGSVSNALVHKSACPVAIVRPDAAPRS